MSDILDTITKVINSPPGQLAAGGVLAGIVWKCFERVEAVLTDDAKLEVAVGLLDAKLTPKFTHWSKISSTLFNAVFGEHHFTIKCFARSCLASTAWVIILFFLWTQIRPTHFRAWLTFDPEHDDNVTAALIGLLILNIVPDYMSLWKSRWLFRMASVRKLSLKFALICDLVFSACIAGTAIIGAGLVGVAISSKEELVQGIAGGLRTALLAAIPMSEIQQGADPPHSISVGVFFYSTFLTSFWLCLYAGSECLVKTARRFDTGFEWLNGKVDIEKKPLQCIGLAAGTIVALVFWAAMIVRRLV